MKDSNKKHNSPVNLKRPHVFIILFILTVFFTGLTWYSFTLPVKVTEEIVTQDLSQETVFDYRVIPRVSTLYPDSEPLTGRDIYLTRVTDGLNVYVKSVVSSSPELSVDGISRVIMKLQAGELWEREYELSSPREFSGTGNFTVIDDTFTLPWQNIQTFIQKVEEEAQVTPGDGYTLSVIPVINAYAPDKELENKFAPTYDFNLKSREFRPVGESRQENKVTLKNVNTISGNIYIGGFSFPVVNVRYVFSILTAVCLAALVWRFKFYRRYVQSLSEVYFINRRYRGRIVTAQNSVAGNGMTVIYLNNFKELLKIADERDKSIIQVMENEKRKEDCFYYVPDGNTLYCYEVSSETPASVIPPGEMKEEAVTGAGNVT